MADMHGVHLSRLELNQLRLIEALRMTGSLTRAAEELGLSQPAASHSLARLRKLLGDPLFVRTTRGMEPTAYGESLAARVREGLDAVRKGLDGRASFEPATAQRTFRFYTSDIGQLVFLPPLLKYVRDHAPGIGFEVRQMPLRDPSAALERGDIDLAVGHITAMPGGFHQRHLFDEGYVCAVSQENARFAHGMSIKAFSESQHALADSTGMGHSVIDRELGRHGIVREAGLRVPEFLTLAFLIPGSDLVLTMPSRLADRFGSMLPLRILEPPVPFSRFPVRLFWHERVHRDEGHRWLRGVFVHLFAKAPKPKR